MREEIAFPYQTVSDQDSVLCKPWVLKQADGSPLKVKEGIPGWDYNLNLTLEREFNIDINRVLRETGHEYSAENLILAVIPISGAEGNSYKHPVRLFQLPAKGLWSETIQIELDSSRLASKLVLETIIFLNSTLKPKKAFVAKHKGSRLWEDLFQIPLEGTLGRFPMVAIDFNEGFPKDSSSGLWYLSWDPDALEQSFLGNVTLYVNSGNKNFIEKIRSNDPLLISLMVSDIVRQVCLRTIDLEDIDYNQLSEYESGTLGYMIKEWLSVTFGDFNFNDLRARKKNNPSEMESIIQSTFFEGNE